MDRAEEASLKAYPVKKEWVGNQYGDYADINEDARRIFQEGYRQSELDYERMRDPIAWIKRIYGKADMTRAEEVALRAYPPITLEANYTTIGKREACKYGYMLAEQDLALTWEDMLLAFKVINTAIDNCEGKTRQEVFQEAARLFNEQRQK